MLSRVLRETGPLLLDFDGPLCAVFAGVPAASIAAELRQTLAAQGVDLPVGVVEQVDPLEVLRYTAGLGDLQLTARVDDQLRLAEWNAVRSATATRHAREVIVGANRAGRALAVVSNNAACAIRAYLDSQNLTRYIEHVVGRHYADPSSMKPSPTPVQEALRLLGSAPESCALLGDSVSDIQAGQLAGVSTIGYANKPGKVALLTSAGADAVIEGQRGMALLARLLNAEATDV